MAELVYELMIVVGHKNWETKFSVSDSLICEALSLASLEMQVWVILGEGKLAWIISIIKVAYWQGLDAYLSVQDEKFI